MHEDMQEDRKQAPRKFNLGLPVDYMMNPKEISNALYLLGHFGLKVDRLDTSLIADITTTDVELLLEECIKRFEPTYGPVDPRVYQLINTWYQNTTQEDRIYKWDAGLTNDL